jgi:hypothetical protein
MHEKARKAIVPALVLHAGELVWGFRIGRQTLFRLDFGDLQIYNHNYLIAFRRISHARLEKLPALQARET